MGKILPTVRETLGQMEWSFEEMDKRDAVLTGVRGDAASYRIVLDAKEEAQQLLAYVISPTRLPEAARVAGAEFAARANYGLIIGNFDLDLSDGEVRYKVSVDVEGSKLTVKMVRNMIGCGVAMMDRYYKGWMAVGFGGRSPAEAVADCEG